MINQYFSLFAPQKPCLGLRLAPLVYILTQIRNPVVGEACQKLTDTNFLLTWGLPGATRNGAGAALPRTRFGIRRHIILVS